MEDSYEYEYSDEDYNQEEEDDDEIEIQNMFVEAEDNFNSNPDLALEQFHTIIMMQEQKQYQNMFIYQSYQNIVLIMIKKKDYTNIKQNLSKMVNHIHQVSKNEANESLNQILIKIQMVDDLELKLEIFDLIQQKVYSQNMDQLWLKFALKLCNYYLEYRQPQKLNSLIELIQSKCQSDEKRFINFQQELYSIQIQQCLINKNSEKLKQIYTKTKNLQSNIVDTKSLAIIKETSGKLLILEENYKQAQNELTEAFKLYQEIGNQQAKQVLIYLTISGILNQSQINPFHSREARVFLQDQDIIMVQTLRQAFEDRNSVDFYSILESIEHKLFKDEFSYQFSQKLKEVFCIEKVQDMIKPYKKVKIEYLANKLKSDSDEIQRILVNLVLLGKLNGQIDDVNGYYENLEINRDLEKEKAEKVIEQMFNELRKY